MTEFIEEMNDSNFEQVVLESKRRVEVIALLRLGLISKPDHKRRKKL